MLLKGKFDLVVLTMFLAGSTSAAAPPVRLALVIGESTYAALPPLPACAGSARAVAGALRHLGFRVIEKLDATNGETDAALEDFLKRRAGAPDSPAVFYFCGYGAGLGERAFLLPVTAAIERPFDLITQGVLANSAFNAMTTRGAAGGLLALDVFARPGDSAPIPLARLAPTALGPGGGVVGVVETNPNDAETPLAGALVRGLSAPRVDIADLIAALPRQVAAVPGSTVAVAAATAGKSFLAGRPPPPRPAPVVAPQKPAAAPAVPRPASPKPAIAAAPPVTPPSAKPAEAPSAPPAQAKPAEASQAPAPSFPDEAHMTLADRRRVQAALALRGYYSGRIDGIFGPETRAAIVRFQQTIGAEPNGILSGEQAGRLVAGVSEPSRQ